MPDAVEESTTSKATTSIQAVAATNGTTTHVTPVEEKKEDEGEKDDKEDNANLNNNGKNSKAFKRVREDEITVDPRLADNSYEALQRRGNAWGAKANQVLGAVRGKGFRHEKTKKKRGTYRGGQIDVTAINSIKFDD